MMPGFKPLTFANLLLAAFFAILLCVGVTRHGDVGPRKDRRDVPLVHQELVVSPVNLTVKSSEKTPAVLCSADRDGLPCAQCQGTDCLAVNGHSSQPPSLVKRAYQLSWNTNKVKLTYKDGNKETDAVLKGEGLLCKLTAGAGPASPWTNQADLTTWGWSNIPEKDQTLQEEASDLVPVLEKGDLNIDTGPYPRNQIWRATQEESTPALEEPTFGDYTNSLNPKNGVILALGNYSPAFMADEGAPLPDLQNWSDMVWFQWEMACKDQGIAVGDLEYVFRANVINDDTKFIISKALGSTSVDEWPDTKFMMDTDEGKAILATPNGRGVAWFLINHQTQMGVKTVESVTVFSTTKGPYLAFKIGNV